MFTVSLRCQTALSVLLIIQKNHACKTGGRAVREKLRHLWGVWGVNIPNVLFQNVYFILSYADDVGHQCRLLKLLASCRHAKRVSTASAMVLLCLDENWI